MVGGEKGGVEMAVAAREATRMSRRETDSMRGGEESDHSLEAGRGRATPQGRATPLHIGV